MAFELPERAARELGWPELLAAIAARTATDLGRARALALPWLAGPGDVERSLAEIEEARTWVRTGPEAPLQGARDVRQALARASRGGVLEPAALLEVALVVRASARTRALLDSRQGDLPLLAARAEALQADPALAAAVERTFDSGGMILDQASPRLAELRARVRAAHAAIKERVEGFLADPLLEEVLQDRYFSVRNDRYVIPVKIQHRARVPGMVHNASRSGETVFIEPHALQEMGNSLVIAESIAQEEERRILTELSTLVGEAAPDLDAALETLAGLDALLAAARLAEAIGAEPPALGERLELRGVRHPLLALKGPVVANDLTMGDARCLLVSGPNAGGKTVTMTAVGLCALMARAGLPIPAAKGSRIPLYDGVRSVIAEQGDLDRGLSTFTAHLGGLLELAREAGPGLLACVDEIAAGTDPREGAALGRAVLEDLLDRGATVLVTTHLEELKALGIVDARFLAARMGFDPLALAPTYQLTLGAAGASSALAVARRVGLPERVAVRAEALLAEGGTALSLAVAKLDAERAGLARARGALREETAGLQEARADLERQRVSLAEKERELVQGARRELVAEIEESRRTVREIVARLQAAPKLRAAGEAREALDRAHAEQTSALAVAQARNEPGAAAAPGRLAAGDRVRVATLLGQEGEVIGLEGEEVIVAVGALRTRVGLADVVRVPGKAKGASFPRAERDKAAAAERVAAAALQSAKRACDVRGMRVDEALRELDLFLDRLYGEGAPDATVVHGHGSGALKTAVREHLAASPYVRDFRPGRSEEGGDGVTVADLGPGTAR